jgi:hypothetical protein
MKTHRSLARAGHGGYMRRGRASGVTRRLKRGTRWSRQHGNTMPQEFVVDMGATVSLLDLIDVFELEVHSVARFIYPDDDAAEDDNVVLSGDSTD